MLCRYKGPKSSFEYLEFNCDPYLNICVKQLKKFFGKYYDCKVYANLNDCIAIYSDNKGLIVLQEYDVIVRENSKINHYTRNEFYNKFDVIMN